MTGALLKYLNTLLLKPNLILLLMSNVAYKHLRKSQHILLINFSNNFLVYILIGKNSKAGKATNTI
jgi:hypothetical protein